MAVPAACAASSAITQLDEKRELAWLARLRSDAVSLSERPARRARAGGLVCPILPRQLRPALVRRNFGPVASRFEAALAAQFGEAGDDAFVAASSATAALAACLIAGRGGAGHGSRAGLHLFRPSAAAIRMAEAEPALVDVDPASWACDLASLEREARPHRRGCGSCWWSRRSASPWISTSRHVALCAGARDPGRRRQRGRSRRRRRARQALRGGGLRGLFVARDKALRGRRRRCDPGAEGPRRGDCAQRSISGCQAGPQRAGPAGRGINGKMPEVSAAIGMAVLAPTMPIRWSRAGAQARRYIEMIGLV